MKTLLFLLSLIVLFISCDSSNKAINTNEINGTFTNQDTIRIANDVIEYEIIIIDPGFNFWLRGTAKPEGYYSQEFMEGRNYQYVTEWNNRVLQPHRYRPNLYSIRIDYDPGVDYGYEVNYLLYNYFIYFQLTYNQRLAGYVPRI